MKNISILLSTVLLISCSNEEIPIIKGQVVLSDGTPVSKADIHVSYQWSPVAKSMPNTIYSFQVQEYGKVSLASYSYGTGNLVEILVEQELSPGSYTVPISDSLYTNGIYNFVLIINSKRTNNRILFSKNAEHLIGVKPLTTTNNAGDFLIVTDYLGIGETFNNGGEVRVTNQIEFIAIKDSTIITRDTVFIDESKTSEILLIVE